MARRFIDLEADIDTDEDYSSDDEMDFEDAEVFKLEDDPGIARVLGLVPLLPRYRNNFNIGE